MTIEQMDDSILPPAGTIPVKKPSDVREATATSSPDILISDNDSIVSTKCNEPKVSVIATPQYCTNVYSEPLYKDRREDTPSPVSTIDNDDGEDDEVVLNTAATLLAFSSTPPSLSASPAPKPADDTQESPQSDADGKIRAYAKLQGPDWSFYLKKPSLTMGRAPSQQRQFTAGDSCPVDFYLSSADSLSRTHLRIDYNPDRSRWEMSCLGKSGVRVDGRRYEAFCPPIHLSCESIISVANATFTFHLPGERKRSVSVMEQSEDTAITNAVVHTNISETQEEHCEYTKPPQSYANLIAEAISSTPSQRMTLSCIYQYLADHYPYFRHTKNGWQNSVRHNLSLNKAFKKVPRGPDEPGKGMLWIIDPDYKHLVDGSIGRNRTNLAGGHGMIGGRARTPDITAATGRPSFTFIPYTTKHTHTSQGNAIMAHGNGNVVGVNGEYQYGPVSSTDSAQRNYNQVQSAPLDPSHLRPIATIAAAISPTATLQSMKKTNNPASSTGST